MNRKIKIIPVDSMDIFEMEAYLSDMAAKGYLLKKIGGLGYFEKVMPQKRHYHLAPFIESDKLAEEQRENYQKNGWEYVCAIGKILNVYSSAEEQPIKVDENPKELIERYEKISNYLKKTLRLNIITTLIYFLMVFLNGILEENKILAAIEYDTWWYMMVIIVTALMSFKSNRKIRLKIKALINKLTSGTFYQGRLDYEQSYKNAIKKYIEEGISILMLIITGIILIHSLTSKWEMQVTAYRDNLPIMRLEEIEPNINFERKYPIRHYDEITCRRTGLAPRIYEINQSGKVQGEVWQNSEYTPWIETKFYEVRFKSLVKPLLKDLMQDEVKFYEPEVNYQKIENTNFDEMVYVQIDGKQMIFVCLGKKVMYTCYEGSKDMKQYIAEIYDLIKVF